MRYGAFGLVEVIGSSNAVIVIDSGRVIDKSA